MNRYGYFIVGSRGESLPLYSKHGVSISISNQSYLNHY